MPRSIRPIRIDGDVAYVPLSRGYEAIIDTADIPLVAEYGWFAITPSHTVYARTNMREGGKQASVLMHRLIIGARDGEIVDHVSCNGLDNRRSNLRIATPSQSTQNQRRLSTNKSGFKGVHWHNQNHVWRAQIQINGKRRHIGCFETAEAAYEAYCLEASRLFGEFARVA
jgi:hypothetical protein